MRCDYLVALAVGVQEGEDARRSSLGPLHPGPHQALPLVVPQHSHFLDRLELLAILSWKGKQSVSVCRCAEYHLHTGHRLTVVTEVIHQDDFLDEVLWTAVEDTDDSPKECGPRLVVEGDDDGGGGKLLLLPCVSLARAAPCIRDFPVAGHLIRGRLVKLVPCVGILPSLRQYSI